MTTRGLYASAPRAPLPPGAIRPRDQSREVAHDALDRIFALLQRGGDQVDALRSDLGVRLWRGRHHMNEGLPGWNAHWTTVIGTHVHSGWHESKEQALSVAQAMLDAGEVPPAVSFVAWDRRCSIIALRIACRGDSYVRGVYVPEPWEAVHWHPTERRLVTIEEREAALGRSQRDGDGPCAGSVGRSPAKSSR